MAIIKTFKDLIVWQKAHDLVLYTYKITKKLPREESFVLVTQMRRAAISVACNIVEGHRRLSVKESLKFYNISSASLEELKYQFLICRDLFYFDKNEYEKSISLSELVGSSLFKWIESQKNNAGIK